MAAAMPDILYRWPTAAKYGKRVPKEKFYEHGAGSSAVREKFTTQVQNVVWSYKLAESTINLRGTAAVPEIQVFTINAKAKDVSESVLGVIDKAIKFPVIFEVARHRADRHEIKMVAAHKLIGERSVKLSRYYSTDWQLHDRTRQPLPTALTLPALYSALLQPLTPVTFGPGVEMSEVADKLEMVRKLGREIAALERKIANEPQLNRRLDLFRALKAKKQGLERITNG